MSPGITSQICHTAYKIRHKQSLCNMTARSEDHVPVSRIPMYRISGNYVLNKHSKEAYLTH